MIANLVVPKVYTYRANEMSWAMECQCMSEANVFEEISTSLKIACGALLDLKHATLYTDKIKATNLKRIIVPVTKQRKKNMVL